MLMAKAVSEPTRARETFRYYPSLVTEIKYNDSSQALPSAELTTSSDPVLTALARLGACQLQTARALISLFDQDRQYVIAEATPTLPLKPSLGHGTHKESLWLCGTAIPRRHAVCEHTLCADDSAPSQDGQDPADLTVTLVSDVMCDPRFSSKPYCQPGNPARFYAGVPIRTRRGINIGVFCVVDPEPRDLSLWSEDSLTGATQLELMRGISLTITRHLESARSEMLGRRNERMSRGLGSFIEGKSTMSGWRSSLSAESFENKSELEGALNANQQAIQLKDEQDEQDLIHQDPSSPLSGSPQTRHPKGGRRPAKTGADAKANKPGPTMDTIFSRAANVIRESIEVEGVVFLDATVSSFGGLRAHVDLNNEPARAQGQEQGQALSSSDETGTSDVSVDNGAGPLCRVIGFSTSDSSSIDGAKYPARRGVLPEKFLGTLLRRYPAGKIFNFDQNGALQSSDSSEDNAAPTAWHPHAEKPEMDTGPAARSKRRKKPFARQHEGSIILKSFPAARSVAFVPVWNSRKERWLAGGFVYTVTPTRVFTPEGELSYLRALGMLAMAEVLRQETAAADKAKSDVLSSLSHELRSPLHGVVLGVEMLHDTELDVFQENVLHTLETCSRTLVDTIDHLLDYSKINNYTTMVRRQRAIPSRGANQERLASIEDGMKSLYSDVRLDVLCEEVLESVFAGFSFQSMSIAQLAKQKPAELVDVYANRQLDRVQAIEQLGPLHTGSSDETPESSLGKVSVSLDIDPACSWMFRTQPGAIRRIVMNLFGNSLKYTKQGAIRLLLRQDTPKKRVPSKPQTVKIKIIDTGKGISEDYLRDELFSPFAQEDRLAPGTGLGLSLVKQIVSQLKGSISVESRVGLGTTVSVSLPLEPVRPSPLPFVELSHGAQSVEDRMFEEQVLALRGLRIRLLGFDGAGLPDQNSRTGSVHCSNAVLMEKICRGWLHMDVIPESKTARLAPDLILCTEDAVQKLYRSGADVSSAVPTVVVCPNALVARRLSISAQFINSRGVFEFISQPIGPRKLAKILLFALKRWVDIQVFPTKTGANSLGLTTGPLSLALTPPRLASPDTCTAETPMTKSLFHLFPETNTMRPKPARNFSSSSTLFAGSEREGANDAGLAEDRDAVFLLVDDNHINLKILTSYMKKLGRPYITATNGQEAVDAYRRQGPQARCKCVFMDISMPVMDGFEATRRIRAHESEQDLEPATIFALTGLASTDAQQEAFRSGIDLFLAKPVKLREISSILGSRGLL